MTPESGEGEREGGKEGGANSFILFGHTGGHFKTLAKTHTHCTVTVHAQRVVQERIDRGGKRESRSEMSQEKNA